MKIWKLVWKQWPWLVGYIIVLLILALFFQLYNLPRTLVGDLLRYTWFICLAVIGGRAIYQAQQLKKLQQLKTQKSPAVPHFSHPVLQAYSQAFQECKQQLFNLQQQQDRRKVNQQDYLKIWSHEIKTPLTALAILAEDQTQVSSSQVQQQISLIQNQLDLLLNYQRFADFHHDLDFCWQKTAVLLQPIIQKYAIFFAQKHLHLHLEVDSQQLLTDSKWFSVVLEQIIFNAIKYSPPQTTITIHAQDQQLLIQDQGIGIASTDLPRIFEPGFTGNNGRKQQVATGMGLYLAFNICQRLNINLEVQSQLNQGTTVILGFAQSDIR